MIGALIGAGVQVAGSIANGIITRNAQRKAQKLRDKYFADETAENARWYNREYNTVATDRADAQAAATRTYEAIKERQRARAGAQAVMGGTEEAVQAAQAEDAKAIADTNAQYAIANEARKDQVSQQYQQNRRSLAQAKMEADVNQNMQKAVNVAQTAGQLANAAGGLAMGMDDIKTSDAKAYTTAGHELYGGIEEGNDPLAGNMQKIQSGIKAKV